MAVGNSPESVEAIRRRLHEAVALNPDLDGVDLRVLLFLSARLNFETFVRVPQSELADALNKQKAHISRSIRKLTENGVLEPGPKGTRSSEWRLNPVYGK